MHVTPAIERPRFASPGTVEAFVSSCGPDGHEAMHGRFNPRRMQIPQRVQSIIISSPSALLFLFICFIPYYPGSGSTTLNGLAERRARCLDGAKLGVRPGRLAGWTGGWMEVEGGLGWRQLEDDVA